MTSSAKRNVRGFTLIATLLCLMILTALALTMLSLSAVELRRSDPAYHQQAARSNARLALMLAIGQLQQAMGPDTRVSANSALVTGDGQKYWTGVWSTLAADGKPWIIRDPADGSLSDRRNSGYEVKDQVSHWLVSGETSPTGDISDPVILVGKNSVTNPSSSGVEVPSQVIQVPGQRGKIAWWTGDLGQRVNLNSTAAPEFIGGAPEIPDHSKKQLVSEDTVALHFKNPRWGKDHFHDFTVYSSGLLTNT
ncbi:MAG: hypothetical protein EOP85_07995, partial [Verrucomicrobiaceae bacterium]